VAEIVFRRGIHLNKVHIAGLNRHTERFCGDLSSWASATVGLDEGSKKLAD